MTWFKVDDTYWSHPKVIGLSLAARGLWLTGGVYCATHLTDGFLAEEALHAISPSARRVNLTTAEELVTARMWEPMPGGWVYHDWCDYQPARLDIEARRAANRERLAVWRSRRRDSP